MVSKLLINCFKNASKAESILQTKATKSLPDRLIFARKGNYNLFSTKTKEVLGTMKAYPITLENSNIYYPDKKGKYACFYIDELIAKVKKQGTGSTLINAAKRESLKSGCDGRISLVATCIDDSKISPQTFYHKMGFTTTNKEHLKEIIKQENKPKPRLFMNSKTITPMYLIA